MPAYLNAILSSFALVAISEMGDKTQLLSFSLAARLKKPGAILGGVFVATLLNHWLAAVVGAAVANSIGPVKMAWGLTVVFVVCGFWALIPDKFDETASKLNSYGAFVTTVVLFFLAEMGDKTQLATIALAARFDNVAAVTVGTTLGMMFTNGLAVLLGSRIAHKVQTKWIRGVASAMFFVFGLLSLLRATGRLRV